MFESHIANIFLNSLPAPNQEAIKLRKVDGGIAAVSKFSGKPMEDTVREKEKALGSDLIRDGLKPKTGCLLARYNDPGRTWSFIMVWTMEPKSFLASVVLSFYTKVLISYVFPVLLY